ncbi:mannosyl-3-phosphoglycerate phosphatase [Hahella sp. CCB-MM4]|uniref:HAD-IIB family hydrolase n=1 Tax=Hahella sp. (strain CCB-MM4) TaxID=1926491 RepID=UPI000B9C20A8|nr:HAD-IIB family hydrolase [Hahella sp. CCB-MM4]OZG74656.1 mannosyl-3-phosphoglycerate phosphatase [Hahella sp. CCB-MM4]
MSQLLISTDLDGTLLDHHNYSAAAAEHELEVLRRLNVPCILNTSKTFAELIDLRPQLQHTDAFIVENGAAVYIPKDSSQGTKAPFERNIAELAKQECLEETDRFWRKAFAPKRARMIDIIQELRDGYRFTGFSDMTVQDVMDLTGLAETQARQAMQREYTEPLLWQDSPAALKKFANELADMDLQIQRGGRFAHVMGLSDKSQAMLWVADLYSKICGDSVITMALGDGQNDVGMLSKADIPVVVRSPAHPPPQVPGRNDAWLTEHTGPEGWAEAIRKALDRLGYTGT